MKQITFFGGPLGGQVFTALGAPLSQRHIDYGQLKMGDQWYEVAYTYIPVRSDEECVVMYLHAVEYADPRKPKQ